MIILGIDPGSRKMGYGVIECEQKKTRYIASGVLRFDGKKDFLKRIGLIYRSCQKLSEEFRPKAVAFESLIHVKNVTSLTKLAQSRGAMMAAFSEQCCDNFYEYSPNMIKSVISGYGHADKEGVAKMIRMVIGKHLHFETDDESDGLAIAVCHALAGDREFLKGSPKSRGLKDSLAHRYENL